VKKQINAGVPFTAIAASQKVSEGTLRRRLREEGINP
jgi:DNA-binding Lrp family transcriptional regulator